MKILKQIAVVFFICLLGEVIAQIIPVNFPSSVLSMVLLLAALLLGIIRIEHVQEKANFLLDNMAFFFIPAGVSIIENFNYLKNAIVPFVLICFISMIVTFVATAYSVTLVMRLLGGQND
ncbi:MAG: CidA/LrgA family protein [Erysipelotrichaceae bacterium]|nr:CidA/LrgA family protein [Erysipelotrichaceae bacterium]MDD3810394.1 CidA/LrgA family protein [Erysipelotrichaceae bacterium]